MNFKKLLKLFEAPTYGVKSPDYDVNKPSVYRGDTGVGNPPAGTRFPTRYLPPDEKYRSQRADHYYVDKNKVGYDKFGNPEAPVVPAKRTAPKPIVNPNQDIIDQGNRQRDAQQAVLRGEEPTDRFAAMDRDNPTALNRPGQSAAPAADAEPSTNAAAAMASKSTGNTVDADEWMANQPAQSGASSPAAAMASKSTGTSAIEPAPVASAAPAVPSNAVRSSSGEPVKTGSGGTLTTRTPDQIAAANKTPMGQYNTNQATKSYDSFGDFAKAVGNKITGNASAPTAPTASAGAAQAMAAKPTTTTTPTTTATDTTPSTPDTTTSTSTGPQTGGYGRFSEEELEEELNELMRLSGQPVVEKAVSKQQQKFMGMVHAMQKGKKVKGASPELKKAAKGMSKKAAHDYAATKHKGLPQRVSESLMLEAGTALEHIVDRFRHETKKFLSGNTLDDDLYNALYDYYLSAGEMPYGVAKAREGDPYMWVEHKFENDLAMLGHPRQFQETVMPVVDNQLSELARLAGLSESRVDECGDMDMDQEDSVNISTNMSSDGKKSVTVSAQGQGAEDLMQMLKLAGMGHMSHDSSTEEPVVVVSNDDDEMMDEGGVPIQQIPPVEPKSNEKTWQYAQQPGGRAGADAHGSRVTPKSPGALEEESSQRLIKKLGDASAGAKIYKDMDWNEYIVKFIKDGRMLPEETWHHTDDLEDAMGTAENEIARMSSIDEEYANSPNTEYETVNAITRQGNDLNREKRQYADKPKLGDNPMAMSEDLQSLYDSILVKSGQKVNEFTDVLSQEKGGVRGATMPPPDSEFPPGDKRNMIPPGEKRNASSSGKVPTSPKTPQAPATPQAPRIPRGMNIEPDDGILNLPLKQRGAK